METRSFLLLTGKRWKPRETDLETLGDSSWTRHQNEGKRPFKSGGSYRTRLEERTVHRSTVGNPGSSVDREDVEKNVCLGEVPGVNYKTRKTAESGGPRHGGTQRTRRRRDRRPLCGEKEENVYVVDLARSL